MDIEMKLLNRTEFLAMPENTLYSDYDSGNIEGLYIKDESLNNDFCYVDIVFSVKNNGDNIFEVIGDMEQGKSFPVDLDSYEREGLFDDSLQYVIWENEDVKALIEKLNKCVQ